jgi:hypothetical protein
MKKINYGIRINLKTDGLQQIHNAKLWPGKLGEEAAELKRFN